MSVETSRIGPLRAAMSLASGKLEEALKRLHPENTARPFVEEAWTLLWMAHAPQPVDTSMTPGEAMRTIEENARRAADARDAFRYAFGAKAEDHFGYKSAPHVPPPPSVGIGGRSYALKLRADGTFEWTPLREPPDHEHPTGDIRELTRGIREVAWRVYREQERVRRGYHAARAAGDRAACWWVIGFTALPVALLIADVAIVGRLPFGLFEGLMSGLTGVLLITLLGRFVSARGHEVLAKTPPDLLCPHGNEWDDCPDCRH